MIQIHDLFEAKGIVCAMPALAAMPGISNSQKQRMKMDKEKEERRKGEKKKKKKKTSKEEK